MNKIIVITGASSGFGALAARALAVAGHRVYAGMRETSGRNAPQEAKLTAFAKEHACDLRWVEMDVASQESVEDAIKKILAENGGLDVVVHNAGHMVFGPAEAFTPEQLAELYDVNVLSTQRVNRAVLPTLRKQGEGLIVWVGSSSTRGGTPPYLAPYFAAKAGMDSLAVSYAGELARFGIETSIIIPARSPRERTTSFMQASRKMRRRSLPMKPARMQRSGRKSWMDLRGPLLPTQTSRQSQKPSCTLWTCHSASVRSEFTSIPQTMAQKSSTVLPTVSVPNCYAT